MEGELRVIKKEVAHILWTYLYSKVVLDLISLYLFSVYIDVFFLPPLAPGCF